MRVISASERMHRRMPWRTIAAVSDGDSPDFVRRELAR
jgi:hypothetical protein